MTFRFLEIAALFAALSHAALTQPLPLPVAGYRVYMVGELHGLLENEEFGLRYLELLHAASGLRDVAIEEDAVYEPAAQAFVEGRSEYLPRSLVFAPAFLRESAASTPRGPARESAFI